jgi:hypothetical protein
VRQGDGSRRLRGGEGRFRVGQTSNTICLHSNKMNGQCCFIQAEVGARAPPARQAVQPSGTADGTAGPGGTAGPLMRRFVQAKPVVT